MPSSLESRTLLSFEPTMADDGESAVLEAQLAAEGAALAAADLNLTPEELAVERAAALASTMAQLGTAPETDAGAAQVEVPDPFAGPAQSAAALAEQAAAWDAAGAQEQAELADAPTATAEAAKERGNALYKSRKFGEAVKAYSEAIELDPSKATYWLNRAVCHGARKAWRPSAADAAAAIERSPSAKAHYRLAKAQLELYEADECAAAIEAGLLLADETQRTQLMELLAKLQELTQPLVSAGHDISLSPGPDGTGGDGSIVKEYREIAVPDGM